jgi:hypothetical protein
MSLPFPITPLSNKLPSLDFSCEEFWDGITHFHEFCKRVAKQVATLMNKRERDGERERKMLLESVTCRNKPKMGRWERSWNLSMDA